MEPREKIYKLTKIDYWFLDQINEIIAIEKNLSNLTLNDLDENQILHIKEKGYSDSRIAEIIDSTENEFRELLDQN